MILSISPRPLLLAALLLAAEPAFAQEAPPAPATEAPYTLAFTLQGDGAIEERLKTLSQLETRKDDPPVEPLGIRRRAEGDRSRLLDALHSEGYYDALVVVRLAGRPIEASDSVEAIEAAAARGPVPVEVAVTTGDQYSLGAITVVEGDLALKDGPAHDVLGLNPGEPARAPVVLAADAKLVDWLRERGYATAKVSGRKAVVDHKTKTMDVTIVVAPGPVLAFGPVTVSGTADVDADFVAVQAAVPVGKRFSAADLKTSTKELQRLEVFQSIRMVEGEPVDGTIPIRIEVEERKRHLIGFETSYSSTEGALLKGYWAHRNLFGRGERLRLDASVSRLLGNAYDDLEYKLGAAFRSPGVTDPKTDLLIDAELAREAPDAYSREGGAVTAALEHRFSERLTGKLGVEIEASRSHDVFGNHEYLLFGFPGELAYDGTDNALDPTTGWRGTVAVEPFPGLIGEAPHMMIMSGSIAAYQALDDDADAIAAGRIKLASILGAGLDEVPANRRLYAGGGGSLRGFAFQGASPRDALGRITGGRSLVETSLELRYKITNEIGIVPFVDAGGAFSGSLPDAGDELRVAVGLGFRYYTPIGPLRLDIGVPVVKQEEDPRFAFYISLGQAF